MASATLKQTAEAIRRHYPEIRESLVTAADLALSGRHVFPGTGGQPHFIGDPIGWTDLSLRDEEYVWALNRMFHWPLLGQASLLTGDRHYAQRIVDEWTDWIKRCPPPDYAEPHRHESLHGPHPWRLLEIGIRSYDSWPRAWDFLAALDMLTPELADAITHSARQHGQILATHSPQLWPKANHNHFLMEMLGLFTLGIRFPQFAEAAGWRELAFHQLERCMENQMTAEGAQIEACPHYHSHCVGLFSQAVLLAQETGKTIPENFLEKFHLGVAYSLQSTRPTGVAVPWGDSDPDLLCVGACLAAWRVAEDAGPSRVLSKLLGREEFFRLCGAHIWGIPDFERFKQRVIDSGEKAPPRWMWFRAVDQVAARSAWEPDALGLFLACRSPVFNEHAHIDPGSFELTALGKTLLVDPGRYTYRNDDGRYEFKRAASHNMLLVDDRDPFEYLHAWIYGSQKIGHIIDVREPETGILRIVCEHENYLPALHRRTVFIIGSEAVVLLDRVTGLRPEQKLQLYFHFDSTTVQWNEAAGLARSNDPGVNLAVLTSHGLRASLLPGRISERIDVSRPSTRLRLSDDGGNTDRLLATVLIPFRGDTPPSVEATHSESDWIGSLTSFPTAGLGTRLRRAVALSGDEI
jgi:hypothetical protein